MGFPSEVPARAEGPLLLLPVPAATSSGPALVWLRMGKAGICVADPYGHRCIVRGDAWCQVGEPCLDTETALERDTARHSQLIRVSLWPKPPCTSLVLAHKFMLSWSRGGLDPVSPCHAQQV